ncbi:MAG: hypothetical protein U9R43_13830 [Thermodesulfobacteriota bacterium]|nr:hypothetical protein [Thermodesulfobacteriota bacterium]
MKNIIKSIVHFKKFLEVWFNTIKIYIRTKFMSKQEKNDILIQAKTQSEAILINKGLTIPFGINLAGYNFKKDSSFRTVAKYNGSSMNGVINISIKSHLLSNDVDMVMHNILHEYSHDIYQEGINHPHLFFEILNLKKYYSLINYNLPQDDFIFYDVIIEEEQFCEFFPLYLNEKLKLYFNKEEIEEIETICKKITKEYLRNRNIITPEHPT